ncbi:MAG TPA: cytochrome c oxidase subunit 4 [Protaetiibacter sp.]|nr:cytochrome c oxidase subunit 4 [Protaetiibacter sp.]
MKTNAIILNIIGVFFLLSAAGYTIWLGITVNWDWNQMEWVGMLALTLTAVLGFFLGYYLNKVHKSQGGELPQDTLTADIDDDDPEVGHFAPWSWWPLMLGGAIALVFLGLAVGFWIAWIAVPLVIVAIVGWTYEYYRNYFAR